MLYQMVQVDSDASSEILDPGSLALKTQLAAVEIPLSRVDETINVADWNIRELGKVRCTETVFTTLRKSWAGSIS